MTDGENEGDGIGFYVLVLRFSFLFFVYGKLTFVTILAHVKLCHNLISYRIPSIHNIVDV